MKVGVLIGEVAIRVLGKAKAVGVGGEVDGSRFFV
jgi:hypothetical protein